MDNDLLDEVVFEMSLALFYSYLSFWFNLRKGKAAILAQGCRI
jgi:hypothetical protein